VEGEQPSYAQLYVHDPAEALNIRGDRNSNLNPTIMTDLQAMMHETHPYVPLYKQAFQIMRAKPPEQHQKVIVKLHMDKNADGRRYNLPTADEIAAIIPGDGLEERSDHRDIVIRLMGGGLKRISHLHPGYSTLHYTMLFPRGEEGYHTEIPLNLQEGTTARSKYVSQRCYYAFRLQRRPGEPPALLMGGRLLQQYVVDAWASTEQSELNWIRHHQKELRSDAYQDLRTAAADGAEAEDRGKRVILPSSHLGSPRHMYQLFQDSMAICCHCRKPDLFITMTTNPKWPEITEALLKDETAQGKRQEPSDRPDIVARVFVQKMQALLKDVRDGLFGKVTGMVYTVEFQKRGLPHMHLLLFLSQEHKIRNPKDVDDIVSAQIPDPVAHPLLYDTVTKNMYHGPCGPADPTAVCMVDRACSKHYPKHFQQETLFGDSGYPEYARPDNGRTFIDRKGNLHDNKDIIPHNPYLCAKYGQLSPFFSFSFFRLIHLQIVTSMWRFVHLSKPSNISTSTSIKAMTVPPLKSPDRVRRPSMRSKTMWMLATSLP
jgi:Helitron helicase-like domain at N-terminus